MTEQKNTETVLADTRAEAEVVSTPAEVVSTTTEVTESPKKKKKEVVESAPELSSGHFYYTRQTIIWHAGDVDSESVTSDGSGYFCRPNLPENAKPAPKGMKVIESDLIVDRLVSLSSIMFWGYDEYGTYTELSVVGNY